MTITARTRAAIAALPIDQLRHAFEHRRAHTQHGTRVHARAEPSTPRRTCTTRGVTPVVAALAARHQIDASTLTGTGAGGRITTADVQAAADEALYARLFPASSPPTAPTAAL